jgi:hypothetical protein
MWIYIGVAKYIYVWKPQIGKEWQEEPQNFNPTFVSFTSKGLSCMCKSVWEKYICKCAQIAQHTLGEEEDSVTAQQHFRKKKTFFSVSWEHGWNSEWRGISCSRVWREIEIKFQLSRMGWRFTGRLAYSHLSYFLHNLELHFIFLLCSFTKVSMESLVCVQNFQKSLRILSKNWTHILFPKRMVWGNLNEQSNDFSVTME